VLNIICQQNGGFYSAEDADSFPAVGAHEKREGAFCVWTLEEVNEVLSSSLAGSGSNIKLNDVFCFHYDVHPEGNVHIYKVWLLSSSFEQNIVDD
jgi:uncharacterized protein YyaL (SSP411 family)